jgi:RNA polymerase sigma factor (sigma-70 family)
MSPRFSLRLLSGQSDERLLKLARGGHERAFEALVQRYRRPLLRFCRRKMRLSDQRAEDVVQQTLLKAWMALAAGTDVRDFKPWLYSIVRNTALNAMRGHAESNIAFSDAMRASPHADSELERRLEMRDALTHVAALPQAQREAIFLTVIDGQSHEEVASALGITNGAVRGLLYRARRTLRKAAAVITPQPLIAWAAGSAGSAGRSAERIAEVSSGTGAVGAGGLLAKGAVLAVTTGALATGAVVQLAHSPAHRTLASAATAHIPRPLNESMVATPGADLAATSTPAAANAGTASTTRAGSAPSSAGTGGSSNDVSASAPSHHTALHARPREIEHESRSPDDGASAAPESSPPSESAPGASTPTTPAEQAGPAQAQPEPSLRPPTEQPKSGEAAALGSGGADGGRGTTASCKTTEPSKPCDE